MKDNHNIAKSDTMSERYCQREKEISKTLPTPEHVYHK